MKPLRKLRRELLCNALAGTAQDKLDYCIHRAANHLTGRMVIYGSVQFDQEEIAQRVVHQSARLMRLGNGEDSTHWRGLGSGGRT